MEVEAETHLSNPDIKLSNENVVDGLCKVAEQLVSMGETPNLKYLVLVYDEEDKRFATNDVSENVVKNMLNLESFLLSNMNQSKMSH